MKSSNPPFRRARPGLGTLIELSIEGVDFDRALLASQEAFLLAANLERELSFFDPRSELSSLNGCKVMDVSGTLASILSLGSKIEAAFPASFKLMPKCPHTEPCYEVRQHKVIRHSADCVFDLGGIAKGFVVDQIFESLSHKLPGCKISVNAGGDLRVSYEKQIELRVSANQAYLVSMGPGAIATSNPMETLGTPTAHYFRKPKKNRACASVIASTCALADAFTKVALFGEPFEIGNFPISSVLVFDESGNL